MRRLLTEGKVRCRQLQTDRVPSGWERTEWSAVNWRCANRNVRNLRRRIFRATQAEDWKTVNGLQKLMLRSYSNRLVSVQRVTQENRGKRTAGLDKVLVKTPKPGQSSQTHCESYSRGGADQPIG